MEDLQVYPRRDHTVIVKGRIGNATGKPGSGELLLWGSRVGAPAEINGPGPSVTGITVHWLASGGSFETKFEVPEGFNTGFMTWDEFTPECYSLTVDLRLETGPSCCNSTWTTFGVRRISTAGTQFLINGRKTFFRGTLECCIFPKTGHPPMDVESWKRIIGVAKSHGLNLLRFHSYCPPEAAFEAADELGMYLQVETCWANNSTTIGDGKPVDQWVYDETDRILKHYGNHPSFVLMAYGNEPGGSKLKCVPCELRFALQGARLAPALDQRFRLAATRRKINSK